jgi:hypothetical protein
MDRVQRSIYSLCPLHAYGLPQSLQTFLYSCLTSSFTSLQYALKINLVSLQMETTSSSEMVKFIHNPKAIMYAKGNLLFGSDFEKKQHCRRWTLKRSEVAWDSLKNVSLTVTVQEHMQYFSFYEERHVVLYIHYDLSCKFCPNALHAQTFNDISCLFHIL